MVDCAFWQSKAGTEVSLDPTSRNSLEDCCLCDWLLTCCCGCCTTEISVEHFLSADATDLIQEASQSFYLFGPCLFIKLSQMRTGVKADTIFFGFHSGVWKISVEAVQPGWRWSAEEESSLRVNEDLCQSYHATFLSGKTFGMSVVIIEGHGVHLHTRPGLL